MGLVEQAARTQIDTMPEPIRSSTLAKGILELARRLDDDPADSVAVLLNREIRLSLADLREQAKGDAADDVEQYLARVSTPAFHTDH